MIRTETISSAEKVEKFFDGNEILDGIEIVRCSKDGSYSQLRSIILKDRNGKEVEFAGGDSSNRICIIMPIPKTKEVFTLTGRILNAIDIKNHYDSETEATEAKKAIEEEEFSSSGLEITKETIICD